MHAVIGVIGVSGVVKVLRVRRVVRRVVSVGVGVRRVVRRWGTYVPA